MAAPINTNRYRLILLLYLVFTCLSLLSVPAGLLESNLYVIKTLSYQERIIKRQLERSGVLISGVDEAILRQYPGIQNYIDLQREISISFSFLDSIEQVLTTSLLSQGTSIEREYAKRKKLNAIFKNDSLAQKIETRLFALAGTINRYDTSIGAEFSRWLPATPSITTRNGKKVSWINFFFLNKPASVSFMQFKRIKLLLLQTQSDISEQNNSLVASVLLANQKKLSSLLIEQKAIANTATTSFNTLSTNTKNEAAVKQLQLDLLQGIRLDRYYAGVLLPILNNLPSLSLDDVEIEFSPQVKVVRSADRISASFPNTGQYQLKLFLRKEGVQQLLLVRTLNVQRLPDPEVQLQSDNTGSNIIGIPDLIRATGLKCSLPGSGLPSVSLRINGFRVTILGAKQQVPAFYNYGQVFQEEVKQIFTKAKRGDLLLFDNITMTIGDGSTRTAKPVLYKISD